MVILRDHIGLIAALISAILATGLFAWSIRRWRPPILIRTWSVSLFLWLLWFFSRPLELPETARLVFNWILPSITLIQFGWWGFEGLRLWHKAKLEPRIEQDRSSAAALGLFYTFLRAALVITLMLLGLSYFGVDITALLAGLGLGGAALALAAQNVLGDLLSSLSIIMDKPFVVGDFIVAGNDMGTVEKIGLKSTRVRSLSGEQIIFTNKDLLESRVKNFRRLRQRRVVQRFSVAIETPIAKVEKIPGFVREIISKLEVLKFDRCHLASFGGFSLDFEFVFLVADSDFNLFMDKQQTILVDLLKKLESEDIHLAVPVQEWRHVLCNNTPSNSLST